MSDKEFPDGLFVKPPHDNAPDFVIGQISIKRRDFGNYLRGKDDEWLNFDIKESKDGKWYCELNKWKKDSKSAAERATAPAAVAGKPDEFVDDIPF